MKKIFFVLTNNHTWGKGYTLKEAYNNAKVKYTSELSVIILLFKRDITEKELEQLYICWSVNDMGGVTEVCDMNESDKKLMKEKYLDYILLTDKSINISKFN